MARISDRKQTVVGDNVECSGWFSGAFSRYTVRTLPKKTKTVRRSLEFRYVFDVRFRRTESELFASRPRFFPIVVSPPPSGTRVAAVRFRWITCLKRTSLVRPIATRTI